VENTTGSAMLKSGRALKSTRVLQHNPPNSGRMAATQRTDASGHQET
jgi:hypothetical protein